MKTLIIILWMLLLLPKLFGAVTVIPGKTIANYPNKSTPAVSDRFIMEQLSPNTNVNITYLQLATAIISATAVTNNVFVAAGSTNVGIVTNYGATSVTYTIYATNDGGGGGAGSIIGGSSLGSGVSVVVDTNSNLIRFRSFSTQGSAISIGTNGNDIIITNIALTPTEVTNFVLAVSNSLATLSSLQINMFTTNIQGSPVLGTLWLQGTTGSPVTNGARTALEYIPSKPSIRIGRLNPRAVFEHHSIAASNFWDSINIGSNSVAFGEDVLAHASYSSVLGGSRNLVYTGATFSVIGGGTNNSIRTNSTYSVIAGGSDNIVNVGAIYSTIGGGYSSVIVGGVPYSTVGGGSVNEIRAGQSVIGGGYANTITLVDLTGSVTISGGTANGIASAKGFIGGGSGNQIYAGGEYGAIASGAANLVGVPGFGSRYSFIGGGADNQISGQGNTTGYGFIGGGQLNFMEAGNSWGVIGGGYRNQIAGANTLGVTIVGGVSNYVNVSYAAVLGNRITNSTPNSVAIGGMNIVTNDFVSGLFYTNGSPLQRAEVSATVSLTNILSTDFAKMSLWLDQDGDGTFEMQGRNVSVGGVALVAATEMLMGFVQPGARFCFTNQSGGTAVATIVPNSSMWVKQ